MKEQLRLDEPFYGVVLTDSQHVDIAELHPREDIFDCARRVIDCETIEIVEPAVLAKKGCVLLIDEEGKLKDGDLFVNCIASYLYETQEHGDTIIGSAIIVKRNEDSLEMLTGSEALKLAKEMSQLRGQAIDTISKALRSPTVQVKPDQSLSASLRQHEMHNRQPCKNDPMER